MAGFAMPAGCSSPPGLSGLERHATHLGAHHHVSAPCAFRRVGDAVWVSLSFGPLHRGLGPYRWPGRGRAALWSAEAA